MGVTSALDGLLLVVVGCDGGCGCSCGGCGGVGEAYERTAPGICSRIQTVLKGRFICPGLKRL